MTPVNCPVHPDNLSDAHQFANAVFNYSAAAVMVALSLAICIAVLASVISLIRNNIYEFNKRVAKEKKEKSDAWM